jgi:hypothetical protein
MRFHLPFDDLQWQCAAERHRKMRLHLRQLRVNYPPRSVEETALMREYRDKIQEFGRELLKPIV